MVEGSPAAAGRWPVTVEARWRDSGGVGRENRWLLLVLVGLGWMGLVAFALEGRLDGRLLAPCLLITAWLGWRQLRRPARDVVLILEPDRLVYRAGPAGSPPVESVQLQRDRAGSLHAAEIGVDWRARLLMLDDADGREVCRIIALPATVKVRDPTAADEAWWNATMPAGTTRRQPPQTASATALVGAWWPRPDDRWSPRGQFPGRRAWAEGDLRDYDAWDRRERRRGGLMLLGVLVFMSVLMLSSTLPWSLADALAVGPPLVAAYVLALRAVLR